MYLRVPFGTLKYFHTNKRKGTDKLCSGCWLREELANKSIPTRLYKCLKNTYTSTERFHPKNKKTRIQGEDELTNLLLKASFCTKIIGSYGFLKRIVKRGK